MNRNEDGYVAGHPGGIDTGHFFQTVEDFVLASSGCGNYPLFAMPQKFIQLPPFKQLLLT